MAVPFFTWIHLFLSFIYCSIAYWFVFEFEIVAWDPYIVVLTIQFFRFEISEGWEVEKRMSRPMFFWFFYLMYRFVFVC